MSRTYHHGRQQKRKRYGADWWWWRAAPKLWRHYHKHVPQREAARHCRHQVMRGDWEILWPLDRRPYIYYF